jgi:aminomethyltransferase
MVDFHGWELPVQFAGILAEHQAVRTACGVFDVSHMGQIFLAGREAIVRRARELQSHVRGAGPRHLSHLLAEDGGILDDAITFASGRNASWRLSMRPPVTTILPGSDSRRRVGCGPGQRQRPFRHAGGAGSQRSGAGGGSISAARTLPRFGIVEVPFGGGMAILMRTGYTGEEGFEIAASRPASRRFGRN